MAFKPLSCVYGNFVIKQRYVMVIMMQFALLHGYHLRIVLNIAITEMLEPRNETTVDACPEYKYESSVVGVRKYHWPNWVEAFVLYSFYIGYIFTHIPGGWLADKLGSRHVMGVSIVLAAIFNLLLPISIEMGGYKPAVVLRLLLGMAEGPLYPTISDFIQSWVPKNERGFLGGVAFGGANLGTVIGGTLTGQIIHITQSWSMPFYVWGLFALVWYFFYLFTVFSHPSTHPFITEEELNYLKEEIKETKKFKVPWFKIATSLPVWAVIAGQWGHNYIYFTIFTNLPKFMKEIFKMNVSANSTFSTLPFLGLWMSNLLFSYLSDVITNRSWMRVIVLRKVYGAFATMVPAVCCLMSTYVGCNRELAIICYSLGVILLGPFYSGIKVNANDITVHYAGIIMAFVNGFGSLAGVAGPYFVGLLTPNATLQEWHTVYWLMVGSSVFSTIFFLLFASAERQEWDYPDEEA